MEGIRGVVALVAILLLMPFNNPLQGAVATVPLSSCTRWCGNITVPYPFGIELGCYHTASFKVTCRNHTYGHGRPKLFIGNSTVQILGISVLHGTVRIRSPRVVMRQNNNSDGAIGFWGVGLPQGGTFALSASINSIVVVGCGVRVDLRGGGKNSLLASCSAVCPIIDTTRHTVDRIGSTCTGVGCCQANNVVEYSFYSINIYNVQPPYDTYAVYIAEGVVDYTSNMLVGIYPRALSATLRWVINNATCTKSAPAPECRSIQSYCTSSMNLGHVGHLCNCSRGYQGNPYVTDGCQDINECMYPEIYPCYGECQNTPGAFICKCQTGYTGNASIQSGCSDINECKNPEMYSCYGSCLNFPGTFHCQCPDGTHGNPFKIRGCTPIKNARLLGMSIGLAISGGIIVLSFLLFGVPFICRVIKQWEVNSMKQRYFKKNHGLILQSLSEVWPGVALSESMIYSLREMERATDNFDSAHEIGKGGNGIVYKGMLKNLHVVAIKKFDDRRDELIARNRLDRQISAFINEIVMLSQFNHINVLSVLGCCLETEVPMVVYEFIPNGNLSIRLHVDREATLPWDDRLRIALEVARAIYYLQSATSAPIFHRDIKTENILLDSDMKAKLSDFGSARYFPIDGTRVMTGLVHGTLWYLDPEYRSNGRVTKKTDVYSFGVVLIELLTKKKPEVFARENGSIIDKFEMLLSQHRLAEIIDPQVIEEENAEVLGKVSSLAVQCTKKSSQDRPTIKEAEMTLESIVAAKKQAMRNAIPRQELVTKETSGRHYTMEQEISSVTLPR